MAEERVWIYYISNTWEQLRVRELRCKCQVFIVNTFAEVSSTSPPLVGWLYFSAISHDSQDLPSTTLLHHTGTASNVGDSYSLDDGLMMMMMMIMVIRVLVRILRMPVQNSNSKISARPDLATINLLQIPHTNYI